MIEVYPGLFVGDARDFAGARDWLNWWFVQAAKDPWHREALGYTGRAAPRGSEYLVAVRDNRTILNMVDVPDPKYFNQGQVDFALATIWEKLEDGLQVLVHCNQGESRAPSLALLFLRRVDLAYQSDDLPAAAARFEKVYPAYKPGLGMWGFVVQNWDRYGVTNDRKSEQAGEQNRHAQSNPERVERDEHGAFVGEPDAGRP